MILPSMILPPSNSVPFYFAVKHLPSWLALCVLGVRLPRIDGQGIGVTMNQLVYEPNTLQNAP